MRHTSGTLRLSRLTAAFALGSVVVLALPASGSASEDDDEIRREGSCTGKADWEMRAEWDDDQRIEIRGKVHSGRRAQAWRWRIIHNGSVSASGQAGTSGGSFEVRRSLVDLPGVDHCVFRAVRLGTGEVCRGAIDW